MGTYRFAILEVSKRTFEEIAKKLIDTGYDHAFHELKEGRVIDMHGIALKQEGGDPLPQDEVLYESNHPNFKNKIQSNDPIHPSDFPAEDMIRNSEPMALRAGDPRVLINGHPVKRDFRILSEERYQELVSYKKRREEQDKEDRSYHGGSIPNKPKPYISGSEHICE